MKSKPGKKKLTKAKQGLRGEQNVGDPNDKMSRVERQQTKQLQFLAKIKDGQSNLSAKKTLVKKKRKRTREKAGKVLASLSSLADSLPTQEEMTVSAQAIKKNVLRSKSRQQVVLKETKQLAAVLAHPGFQANPFLAIHEHLTNTLPAADVRMLKEDHGTKSKKKKHKSTKKKPSVQQMEE